MDLKEQEFQAKDDARILAEAKVIQADHRRHTAAQKAAAEQARDSTIRAKSMREVANISESVYTHPDTKKHLKKGEKGQE